MRRCSRATKMTLLGVEQGTRDSPSGAQELLRGSSGKAVQWLLPWRDLEKEGSEPGMSQRGPQN